MTALDWKWLSRRLSYFCVWGVCYDCKNLTNVVGWIFLPFPAYRSGRDGCSNVAALKRKSPEWTFLDFRYYCVFFSWLAQTWHGTSFSAWESDFGVKNINKWYLVGPKGSKVSKSQIFKIWISQFGFSDRKFGFLSKKYNSKVSSFWAATP